MPQDRIKALKEAHSLGIHSWVSFEAVIDPEQSLELIRETKDFVDEFKIGRWNHDPQADRSTGKPSDRRRSSCARDLGRDII